PRRGVCGAERAVHATPRSAPQTPRRGYARGVLIPNSAFHVTPMSDLVLFLLIFLLAGAGLLAANLMLGWLVRRDTPSPAKAGVYECGESPVGNDWVQFDLRFY